MATLAVIEMAALWRGETRPETTAHTPPAGATVGARLAIFPELRTMSYDFRSRDDIELAAEPVDGPSVARGSDGLPRCGAPNCTELVKPAR
jgi:hypothetical protein